MVWLYVEDELCGMLIWKGWAIQRMSYNVLHYECFWIYHLVPFISFHLPPRHVCEGLPGPSLGETLFSDRPLLDVPLLTQVRYVSVSVWVLSGGCVSCVWFVPCSYLSSEPLSLMSSPWTINLLVMDQWKILDFPLLLYSFRFFSAPPSYHVLFIPYFLYFSDAGWLMCHQNLLYKSLHSFALLHILLNHISHI